MFKIKIHIFNTLLIIILSTLINSPQASGSTLFGPRQYIRTTGDPNIYEDTFSAPAAGWEATLTVKNGASDGTNRVDKDDTDTLVSSAIVMLNGIEIFGPNDFSKNVYMLEADIILNETNTLYVELRSQPDSYLTIEIVGADPPPTVTFTAAPEIITVGETATLSWTSTDASSCSISPDIGPVDLNGSVIVSPVQTTQYTITATGPGGDASQDLTIQVNEPAISVNIEADPEISIVGTCQLDENIVNTAVITPKVIIPGEPVLLSWTSTNATSCYIEPYIGNVDLNGERLFFVDTTTTFTITADGPGGPVTDHVVVQVMYCPNFGTLTASPSTIYRGIESSTLTWVARLAQTVTIEPDIGNVDLSGSIDVSPMQTTTYTFTATNDQGYYTTKDLTVTVVDPPPTVTIEAVPEEIQLNGVSTLTWQSEYADTCVIEPDIGEVALNGSIQVSPVQTTTYTITATGNGAATSEATVTVIIPQPTVTIDASPQAIAVGGTSTLTWSSTNATSCIIEPDLGTVPTEGSIDVSPTSTTTYSITATGNSTVTAETTVTVVPPPTVVLEASPQSIEVGESTTLTWSSTNATSCTIEPDIGSVGPEGSVTVTPVSTTTYAITAFGIGGSDQAHTIVSVNDYTVPPAINFTIEPETVSQGEPAQLTWTATDAQTVYIDNGIGFVPQNGSLTIYPEHTTSYTATAVNASGCAAVKIKAHVLGTPQPLPEGSFGEMYEDLMPADATIDAYDPERFSLVNGKVLTSDSSPLEGVEVSFLDHPEYGTVLTDAQGEYAIPVEGGKVFTLVFEKTDLITVQRQVDVPWNANAVAETIQMTGIDPVSTTISLDGNPDSVFTHKASIITDEFGTRSCSLVFTGDTIAYMLDKDGNIIQDVTTFITRATEFTTPGSMPAILPPTSAFTYCVELGVDAMDRIQFDKPVVVWLENFLGFDAGMKIPSGYYDRDKGIWVPSPDGLVVRLLDTDLDGTVDALDADGDGLADDLDEDGQYSDEVAGLGDNVSYPPDSLFWRVEITHFTPYDFNYCSYESLINMLDYGLPDSDEQISEDEDCCFGSYSENKSRIFHENIPVPGTDFLLHYTSSRTEGYKTPITVPVSGTTIHPDIKRIIVKVQVAGRTLEQTLSPLPEQTAFFLWDGLDFLGRPVNNTITAKVNIGYVYDSKYMASGYLRMSFGWFGSELTSVDMREEVIAWQNSEIDIHRPPVPGNPVAEGWTLSNHHFMSPLDTSTLYKGDGSYIQNTIKIIDTVAGNGQQNMGADNIPATESPVSNPAAVAFDAEGNLYIASQVYSAIRKVDRNGMITTIAGGLNGTSEQDGIPAVNARIYIPCALAFDTSGNLFIADSYDCRVRKIDTSGIITTVAGNGTQGDSGDGGPAIEAQLSPTGVAVDSYGNIYIADVDHYKVRKVDTTGTIYTIAGDGLPGDTGDGGPASEASLIQPFSVSVDKFGNLYIPGTGNIRKVDTSGIITRIAGNGYYGYSGDDGPATLASLASPYAVTFDAENNLYFSQTRPDSQGGLDCIRRIDNAGIITTIAGTGISGYDGDAGPATRALLSHPRNLAINHSGDIYVPDYYNHVIRKIGTPDSFAGSILDGEFLFADDNGLGYVVSATGRHIRTIDLITGIVLKTFGYDGNNNLVSITDHLGRQTLFDRNAGGLTITSPDGIITTLTIDAENQLSRVTLPDSSYYDFQYQNADGLLTAKIEPEGNRFDYVYSDSGRLTDMMDEEGGHLSFDRTVQASGEILTTLTTGEGNITSYQDMTTSTGAASSTTTYPDDDQAVSASSHDSLETEKALPCGTDMDHEYDVDPLYQSRYIKKTTLTMISGLQKEITTDRSYSDTDSDGVPDHAVVTTTENGKSTLFAQDTLSATKTLSSPEGRVMTTTYDPVTLLTSRVSTTGLLDTTYEYYPSGDQHYGRIHFIRTGTRTTELTYNTKGNLASLTDPGNQTTTYEYDLMGRVTTIHRPDTTDLSFDYDNNGNMTVLINPSDIDHNFGFNTVNLNDSYLTPLSGSYGYQYNKDRQLVGKTFPSGNQIINIYDTTRLMQIQTPEGNIDFTYLCGSKVDTVYMGAESIDYDYDGSLLTSEMLTGTLNQTIGFSHNNDFYLESITYAGGTEQFTYDNDGLLTGSGSYTIARNTGNGLPESAGDGNLNIGYTFNGYGELDAQTQSVNATDMVSWSLTRDNNGRIATKTETVAGITSNYIYTYDPMGRLETVTKDGTLVEEYSYDAVPFGTCTYTMNALRGISGRNLVYNSEDQLLSAGSATYQYNLDGFLTAKIDSTEETYYTYSFRGELLNVTLPDGRYIEYIHDPLGRRIAKKVDGVIVEKYLWQGMTRLLAVFDGSDSLVMRFEYADGRMPVAMVFGGVKYYLGFDQVGTFKVVTDDQGNVVKTVQYDSFGYILNDSDLSMVVPFGFAGGLLDRDTGLVRFGYRDYDPDVGRWTAKDPILFDAGDTDLYGYCLSNPINFIDPSGLVDLNLFHEGSEQFSYAESYNDAGMFTIAGHGGFDYIQNYRSRNGEHLNVAELVKLLNNIMKFENGEYKAIKLYACNTGSKGNGDNFAQLLADELGITVWAPNKSLFFTPNGPIVASGIPSHGFLDTTSRGPNMNDLGRFVPFRPRPRRN